MHGKRCIAGRYNSTPEKGRIIPDKLCVMTASFTNFTSISRYVIELPLGCQELYSHLSGGSRNQTGVRKECDVLARYRTFKHLPGIMTLDASIRPWLRDNY